MAKSYLTKRKMVFSSALEAKKKIETGLVKNKDRLSHVELRLAEVDNTLNAHRKELVGLDEGLETTSKLSQDLQAAVFEHSKIAGERVKGFNDLLNSFEAALTAIEGQIMARKNDLEVIKKEYLEKRKFINEESQRLAIKEADLNIYKRRLEKAITEHNLQNRIKIVVR